LDIEQLPHVVNYELPNVPEDYVHRIGRTGRAGKSGEAVSLVCIDEHKLLDDIEKFIKFKIEKVDIPAFRPDPSIRAESIDKGRGAKNNSRNDPDSSNAHKNRKSSREDVRDSKRNKNSNRINKKDKR
jgi:ATP-dependent RNA helicase RhlE